MKNLKEFDIKDPLNIFMIACICISIGAGCYSWFLLFEDVRAETISLKTSSDKNEIKIAKLLKQKAEEKKLDLQLKEVEVKLIELQKMFPDAENVSRRLKDLYAVFRKTDIDVLSFEPSGKDSGPPKKKNGKIDLDSPKAYYEENYYTVTLNGGYHNFGYFFAELANFEYPTKIDAMEISPLATLRKNVEDALVSGQRPKTVNMKMKLTTFNSRKEIDSKKQSNPKNSKDGKQ